MRSDFKFVDSDNKELHVYKWIPQNKAIGIIVIAHGMTETALRYDEFATILNKNNFIVYGHDHRGHGLTAGSRNELGYIADNEGFDWMVRDVHELIEHIKKIHMNLPIILFGHSMGSFISQRFIEIYGNSINGLILSGSNGTPTNLTSLGVLISKIQISLYGRRHTSQIMNKLSFGTFNKKFKPTRTNYDWLCSVEEEVDKYINNEHCAFICTSSFYYDFLRGLLEIHKNENLKKIPKELPIYIFSGDKDPVGNFGKGIINLFNVFEKLGIKDVEYKLYKDGRHEMLNEQVKYQVIEDVISWLYKRFKN